MQILSVNSREQFCFDKVTACIEMKTFILFVNDLNFVNFQFQDDLLSNYDVMLNKEF